MTVDIPGGTESTLICSGSGAYGIYSSGDIVFTGEGTQHGILSVSVPRGQGIYSAASADISSISMNLTGMTYAISADKTLTIGSDASPAVITNAADCSGEMVCSSKGAIYGNELLNCGGGISIGFDLPGVLVSGPSGYLSKGRHFTVSYDLTLGGYDGMVSVDWAGTDPFEGYDTQLVCRGGNILSFGGSSAEENESAYDNMKTGTFKFRIKVLDDNNNTICTSNESSVTIKGRVKRTRPLDLSLSSDIVDNEGKKITPDKNGNYMCAEEGWVWNKYIYDSLDNSYRRLLILDEAEFEVSDNGCKWGGHVP